MVGDSLGKDGGAAAAAGTRFLWARYGTYIPAAYRTAIQRACDRAFPHPTLDQKPAAQLTEAERQELKQWRSDHRWHPHQLRHTYATEARRAGLPIEEK